MPGEGDDGTTNEARNTKMRVAIYARMSTDKQSADSPADQVARCREYAEREAWQVVEDLVVQEVGCLGRIPSQPTRPAEPDRPDRRVGDAALLGLLSARTRLRRSGLDS